MFLFFKSRTTWSYVATEFKSSTHQDNNKFLGWINSIFLLCYACSLAIFGKFGDKINLKYFVGIGMVSASIFFGLVGILGFFKFSNLYVY